VIIAVDDTPVTNHLDFELGLFKVRNHKTAPLTVARAGVGTLTLDLGFDSRNACRKVRELPTCAGTVPSLPVYRNAVSRCPQCPYGNAANPSDLALFILLLGLT
jgi:hypothetical protein